MKIRTGRKNPHTIYLQTGDEPGDGDRCLGLIINPEDATLICRAVTSPWHLNEIHLNIDEDAGAQ